MSMLRSLIHFEVIFVQNERQVPNFIFKEVILPQVYTFDTFMKIRYLQQLVGLFLCPQFPQSTCLLLYQCHAVCYQGFVKELEVRFLLSPAFLFLSSEYFSYLGIFVLSYKHQDLVFQFCIECTWDFYGEYVEYVGTIREYMYFMISVLPVCEQVGSSHLLMSSSVFFLDYLKAQIVDVCYLLIRSHSGLFLKELQMRISQFLN